MVYTVRNEIFPSNTYLIVSKDRCVVIDPGLNFEFIEQSLQEHKLIPVAVIATHGHFDHIGSAQDLCEKYTVPFYIHAADYKMTQSANFFLKVARIHHTIKTPKPTHVIETDRQTLNFEGFEPIEIQKYDGHSAGSCVIRYKNSIFTGDMIYVNYIVPNSFPGEDLSKLRKSIVRLFETYTSDIVVYPGHGRSATLGEIKEQNKDLEKFLTEHA